MPNQRLSPDIRITRNPDLPAHFGTRIPDTPNPGIQMSDKHYFNAFFGSFFQRNGRALYRPTPIYYAAYFWGFYRQIYRLTSLHFLIRIHTMYLVDQSLIYYIGSAISARLYRLIQKCIKYQNVFRSSRWFP